MAITPRCVPTRVLRRLLGCVPGCAGVRASVRPEQLPLSDPLALLEGTTSALRFDMDVFGLSIIEHKPGVIATAYGLLADFIRAVSGAPIS